MIVMVSVMGLSDIISSVCCQRNTIYPKEENRDVLLRVTMVYYYDVGASVTYRRWVSFMKCEQIEFVSKLFTEGN